MTLVGTRPEVIRLSRITAKLDQHCEHIFVHTGQNYDYELNEIFFKDLELVNNKKRKEQIIQLTTMIIKPELHRSSLKVNDMNLIQRSDKIYESDTQL